MIRGLIEMSQQGSQNPHHGHRGESNGDVASHVSPGLIVDFSKFEGDSPNGWL